MFDPQKMDVNEHIDLVDTLGNMLGQIDESKKDKFIDTMPTIIKTHLITEQESHRVYGTAVSKVVIAHWLFVLCSNIPNFM